MRALFDLCRLEWTPEEGAQLEKEVTSILEAVSGFSDFEDVPIERTALVCREDVPGELLEREELLRNAADSIGGMVRIPSLFGEAT